MRLSLDNHLTELLLAGAAFIVSSAIALERQVRSHTASRAYHDRNAPRGNVTTPPSSASPADAPTSSTP